MKIVLFQGGEAGRLSVLPGDAPEAELEELLGGVTERMPLCETMTLVLRADGERLHLPIRYGLHRIGRAVEPVAGDCAVIATDREGHIRDAASREIERANGYIWTVGGLEP